MKKILMLLLPIVLLTACVDSLDDYNTDQKKASVIPPRTLFTNALKGLTDILTTPNVNSNNYRMFVQQWATTTYLDEPRYSMTSRLYSQNLWNAVYRDVLSDLKEARRLIEADALLDPAVKNNQLGLIGILEVYSWDVLVKTFGNVPYSKALDPENLLPEYDDAQAIYTDLLARLDASMALLTSGASLGTADLIYSGDVAKWKKFGNSLKMKMALTIADVDNGKAKTAVEAAAAAGVLAANTDNARFPYIAAAPNNNPVSANTNPLFTSREDFVVANTIVDAMNATSDPRRQFYFTNLNGVFKGGKYGYPNTFADFSKPSAKVTDPTFEALLMDYSEVEFMLAEAAARGYAVTGTAESHYNAAIAASITYWGGKEGSPLKQQAVIIGMTAAGTGYAVGDTLLVQGGTFTKAAQIKVLSVGTGGAITSTAILKADGADGTGEYSIPPTGEVTTTVKNASTGSGAKFNVVFDGGYSTYLARPDVAWATAAGDYKQKIGTQKWLALNNRGWEAWVEWRRLDYPVLTPPLADLKIPARMIYPPSEGTSNTAPYEAAVAKLGGTDSPDVKLFWDKF